MMPNDCYAALPEGIERNSKTTQKVWPKEIFVVDFLLKTNL